MIKYYKFAETIIKTDMDDEFPCPANMDLFEIGVNQSFESDSVASTVIADCCYRFVAVDDLCQSDVITKRWSQANHFHRSNISLYEKQGLECRILSFEGSDKPYAITEELSPKETRVYASREYRTLFGYDAIFASLFSFERLFLRKDTMILHCAYVEVDHTAILFSAPSGTGKSTQADLWNRYRKTHTINGDDALLKQEKGTWYAHGWSVCGSSEICHNASYPIKAIVMLYQSDHNTCRQLSPMEAFKKLYPQIKVNTWSQSFQDKAFCLMDDLISKIPILELGCTISEEAVICLENVLNTF